MLAKKQAAVPILKKLFADNQGQLNAALRLERTARKTEIAEADFVQFYPYPPHYIDLCIGIMSGIRLQPGAPRHYGGSNRTIIKQAYEMLVSRTHGMSPSCPLARWSRSTRCTSWSKATSRTRSAPTSTRSPAVQGRRRGSRLGASGRQGHLSAGVRP